MECRISLSSHSPDQTRDWGNRLGALLQPGDVVALVGELGAGKTTLVQGIARGLGVAESCAVVSPTFTLINEYRGRLPLYHLDCYRIDNPADWAYLGLDEYLFGEGVALIEWADKMESLLPDDCLLITLGYVDDQVRQVEITGRGGRAAGVARALEGML